MHRLRTVVVTALQILNDASSGGAREQYRRRLEQNSHIFASFGALWCLVMTMLVPQLAHHFSFWVCGVGGTAFIAPRSCKDRALGWAVLGMTLIETWLSLREFGDDFYWVGLTHPSISAALLVFFSGLGGMGAVLYIISLCVMLCAFAPTGILALNLCVACLVQMCFCLVLEASLLQQLLQMQKCEAIAVAEKKKSEFMATVCHELKSPLQGMIGLAKSLIGRQEGCQYELGISRLQTKHLELILSSAQRLSDMVSNIMDTAAVVQEKQVRLSRDVVQLDDLVAEVVTLCRHSTDRSGKPVVREGVSLINAVGPLPPIEADARRCTQLIYNLVTNALKFTQQGHVSVSGWADKESRTTVLTFADSGIGIASESLERIFQPFSQEDETAKCRQHDGLGLGLSICKDVVTRHGGTLTVESIKGLGSKFRVVLPYKMKSSVETKSTPAATGATGGHCLSTTKPLQDASKAVSKKDQKGHGGVAIPDLMPETSTNLYNTLPRAPAGSCDSGVDGVPTFTEPWQRRCESASIDGNISHRLPKSFGLDCAFEHSSTIRTECKDFLPLSRAHSGPTRFHPHFVPSPRKWMRSSSAARPGSCSPARAAPAATTPPGADVGRAVTGLWPHLPNALVTESLPMPGPGGAKVDLDVMHASADLHLRQHYIPDGVVARSTRAGGSQLDFQYQKHPKEQALSGGHPDVIPCRTYNIGFEEASLVGTGHSWTAPQGSAPPISNEVRVGGFASCAGWTHKSPRRCGQTMANNSSLSTTPRDLQHKREFWWRHQCLDSFVREMMSGQLPHPARDLQTGFVSW